MILGKLICWITGKHKRGKRIEGSPAHLPSFRCPRCSAVWARKVKVKAATISQEKT